MRLKIDGVNMPAGSRSIESDGDTDGSEIMLDILFFEFSGAEHLRVGQFDLMDENNHK